jgi:hypothetical protein
MTYRKPEILLVSEAVDAIQSSLDKALPPPDSANSLFPSAGAAYEADE